MVSRAEYKWTVDYFEKIYLEHNKPVPTRDTLDDMLNSTNLYSFNPNNTNKDEIVEYTEKELIKFRIHTSDAIGNIFNGVKNNQFSQEQIAESLSKFGKHPITLLEQFNHDYNQNYVKGNRNITTGGLMRIAPYCTLKDDTLDILFELSENECITEPNATVTNVDDLFNIKSQCTMLIFAYGKQFEHAKLLLENSNYGNILEKYIIIDGDMFAKILDINEQFLRSLVNSIFISNNSTCIRKIKQNPGLVHQISSHVQAWLFRAPNLRGLVRQQAFANQE